MTKITKQLVGLKRISINLVSASDSCKLPASEVLVVDIVCHIPQVGQVSLGGSSNDFVLHTFGKPP